MITENGKDLIAKYLLGYVPAYASYIAFGCGAEPGDAYDGTEETMQFEMLRVPISSRSVVNDAGVSKISFAGEIPLEQHYVITEIALWSDAKNAAAQSDSRVLFAFTDDEKWQALNEGSVEEIVYYQNPISGDTETETGDINVSDYIFAVDADNLSLQTNRGGQGARFLNKTIMIRGDAYPRKIFIDGRNVDFSRNASNDLLKLSFAMYPQAGNDPGDINAWAGSPNISGTVRFMRDPSLGINDEDPPAGAAVWRIEDMVTNKYNVAETTLGDIKTSAYGFSWSDTRYVEVEIDAFDPTWYFGIDAMRFDNVTSQNPLYTMSGYSVVPTPEAGETGLIVKKANTNAYAEFRFGVGI